MSVNDHVTGRQFAAARALLGMDQPTLAGLSNISVPTLRRMEATTDGVSGFANNVLAVRRALEEAGIIFEAPAEGGGPGVRLRKP